MARSGNKPTRFKKLRRGPTKKLRMLRRSTRSMKKFSSLSRRTVNSYRGPGG